MIPYTECLFYVLLMLSFSLAVSNISDEHKTNKVFPISVLVIDSIIIFAMLLQMFGVKMPGNLQQYTLLIFFIVLILSFILSLQNVADSNQENKSFSTIVLIVNSAVILMVAFTFAQKLIKK